MYVNIWDIEIITHAAKRGPTRGDANTRLQGVSNPDDISCRCSLSRAHALPALSRAHARTIPRAHACAHASIQIDIAGAPCVPTPE